MRRCYFIVSTTLLLYTALIVSSPTQARFLQTDPVGYKDDIDLYTYVGNDPTNRIDPSGLSNLNLFNPTRSEGDDYLWQAASQWPANDRGNYTISGHGTEDSKYVGGYTHGELADKIRADKQNYSPGKQVFLDACDAGKGGKDSFAQKLANDLGANVIAPTDLVDTQMTVNPETHTVVAWSEKVLNGGKYVVFKPQPKPKPVPPPPPPEHKRPQH